MNSQCVAFYIRSATGNEADLERQKKILRQEFVRRKVGFTGSSVEVYVDPYSSGLKLGPDLLRLKQDIEAGKIQVVLTTSMNRISRNPRELDRFLDFLEVHRVRFISDKTIDSDRWYVKAAEEDAELPRIVLYCRVASRSVSAGEQSISGQLDRLSAAILLGNPFGIRGHLKEIYREHASSLDWSRPLVTKLRNEIGQGKYDLLVVTDLARISRRPEDIVEFLELARGKCRVLSLSEGFDSEHPTKFALSNLSGCAEQLLGGDHV